MGRGSAELKPFVQPFSHGRTAGTREGLVGFLAITDIVEAHGA
ncbi:MAG: hypothetical protein ACLT2T_07665 [Bilophila wadsworthia]